MLTLSPSGIYFSHSRLDTKFSGCGKDIATTLAEILAGHTPVQAIPLITVLEVEGRHISLNNRRLYLFKELLRLGRLPGGVVPVRLQKPTAKEVKKYGAGATLALVAKLNKCGPPPKPAGAGTAAAAAAAGGGAKRKGKAAAERGGGGAAAGGRGGSAAVPEEAVVEEADAHSEEDKEADLVEGSKKEEAVGEEEAVEEEEEEEEERGVVEAAAQPLAEAHLDSGGGGK